ncbi:hypothetical protein [Agromyces sp. ZXT2-6]|uniref:hypothetical protein n=1 Tax=Agromyces sp. ZXT2-6 TaxID=3461153 RepID=UPI004054CBCC
MVGEPRVLELRIHGVANAPPAETLSTTSELVERKSGDEQGSFWRVRTATTPRTPMRSLRRLAKRPGRVDLVTEAYSWGNQARSGGSALAVIGRAFVHLAWLLVLPFGLCNLAYWGRRDIKGADEAQRIWEGGDGARAIRVFALLQTLFYATGLLTVGVNLVALGCFPTNGRVCAALPGFMDGLASWSPVSRSALLAIVPVAVLLLLYLVGLRARGSFDPARSFDQEQDRDPAPAGEVERERSEPMPPEVPPRPPLLSSAVFWQGTRSAQLSERTHLAAVLAFVLLVLATDAHMGTDGAVSLADMTPPGSLAPESAIPFVAMVAGALLLLGAVVLAIAGGMSGARVEVRTKRAWATALLWVAAIGYTGWTLWAILTQRTSARADDDVLVGAVVVPTALAAVGALIALASLTWGYRRPVYRIVAGLLIVSALACVGWAELGWTELGIGDLTADRATLSLIALGLVALAVIVSYLPQLLEPRERERNRLAGWHGNAAAVMLLTAWFSSLVLTSLVVLGVHAWLTTKTGDPDTEDIWRLLPAEAPADAAAEPPIPLPAFYERFAALLVVILVLLILIVGVGAASALRRFPAFSLPTLRFPAGTPAWMRDRDAYLGGTRRLVPEEGGARRGTRDDAGQLLVPRDRYPETEHVTSGRLRSVVQARRVAGLAHRGEPVLTVLAALTAAALVFLGIPYLGELLEGGAGGTAGEPAASAAWESLKGASGWALGLTSLAAVAWVVTNAVTSTERPLGLIWDIVSFFPRAGHPFSPPCYAERAVPEVKKRVMRFIDDEYADGRDPQVILSAHSMGATIAVAAIFALAEEDEHGEPSPAGPRTRRVALLTHGVQLRAYFSRFFPEVFGWRVLGVRGTSGPSLFRSDPWSRQVLAEDAAPLVPLGSPQDPPSLVEHLGGDLRDPEKPRPPRWRNLWRRTDYLGFPVFSYWNTKPGADVDPIDRGATERSPSSYLWTVARHSDYLSTTQYVAARDELVAMLTDGERDDPDVRREPAGPGRPPGDGEP